jgi:hypothetical protein
MPASHIFQEQLPHDGHSLSCTGSEAPGTLEPSYEWFEHPLWEERMKLRNKPIL